MFGESYSEWRGNRSLSRTASAWDSSLIKLDLNPALVLGYEIFPSKGEYTVSPELLSSANAPQPVRQAPWRDWSSPVVEETSGGRKVVHPHPTMPASPALEETSEGRNVVHPHPTMPAQAPKRCLPNVLYTKLG